MRLYGLIGYPLGHSFSKRYFSEKFEREGLSDCRYELFPLAAIGDLPGLLDLYPDLAGFNVTIPYKIQILPFLSRLDPAAETIGAVNTVSVGQGGLTGYNTDAWAFENSLKGFLPADFQGRALVLGTGGSSKAVQYALNRLGIGFTLVSRTPAPGRLSYGELGSEALEQHRLLVQTTPLGMSPETDRYPPIPFHYLRDKHYLYDLVYNPEETRFLQKGREAGCRVKNGLEMLYLQAEKAWEIWNAPRHGS